MVHITTSEARKEFNKTLKAARSGERIILSRHSKAMAAIVPIEDLELLEQLEDRIDTRAAKLAMEEAKEKGTTAWEDLKAELEL